MVKCSKHLVFLNNFFHILWIVRPFAACHYRKNIIQEILNRRNYIFSLYSYCIFQYIWGNTCESESIWLNKRKLNAQIIYHEKASRLNLGYVFQEEMLNTASPIKKFLHIFKSCIFVNKHNAVLFFLSLIKVITCQTASFVFSSFFFGISINKHWKITCIFHMIFLLFTFYLYNNLRLVSYCAFHFVLYLRTYFSFRR